MNTLHKIGRYFVTTLIAISMMALLLTWLFPTFTPGGAFMLAAIFDVAVSISLGKRMLLDRWEIEDMLKKEASKEDNNK